MAGHNFTSVELVAFIVDKAMDHDHVLARDIVLMDLEDTFGTTPSDQEIDSWDDLKSGAIDWVNRNALEAIEW